MATGTAKRFMARAKILTPLLSVQQVKAMLKSGEVFAFFDVREEGEFSTKGHPLFATPLPLSRLEPRAFALLPDPAHAHRADGQRRGRPDGTRQSSRRHAQPDGLHQPRGHERRAEGVARRGLRGLHRRQRAEQGVRRGGRARQRHAAHRCRRRPEAARFQGRHGDPRFAADAGVQQHVDPGRRRLPRRRAGLSRQGLRAQPRARWWS